MAAKYYFISNLTRKLTLAHAFLSSYRVLASLFQGPGETSDEFSHEGVKAGAEGGRLPAVSVSVGISRCQSELA